MSKNKKLIHIHAKCDAFEIWEIKTDKQSAKRVEQIRKLFEFADGHYDKGAGHLTVKTGVLNSELNFH